MCKLRPVWAGKYKFDARAGKYKFSARAGKYKLGAKAGGQGLSKGPRAGNTNTRFWLSLYNYEENLWSFMIYGE